MQVMCKYSRGLFLLIYILFKSQVPLGPLLGKQHIQAKDGRPMVIRISESGKLLLVESGIREFFFHGILNPGP